MLAEIVKAAVFVAVMYGLIYLGLFIAGRVRYYNSKRGW